MFYRFRILDIQAEKMNSPLSLTPFYSLMLYFFSAEKKQFFEETRSSLETIWIWIKAF